MENKYEDAMIVSPDVHKIVLENDRVRVLEVLLMPGVTAKMHSHPPSVIYVTEGGWVEISAPNSEPKKVEFKKGATVFREETVHEVKNIGDTTIEVIHVELKQ